VQRRTDRDTVGTPSCVLEQSLGMNSRPARYRKLVDLGKSDSAPRKQSS